MGFNEDVEQWKEDAREKGKDISTSKKFVEELFNAIQVNDVSIDEPELVEISEKKLKALNDFLTASIGKNVVIYDKREERSGRPDMLKSAMKAFGIECKFYDVMLPIGDYIVNGACIEYKTEEDFIQSKISGHLDVQLFNMGARYDKSYLFVEGDIFLQGEGRVHYNALLSSFLGASFKQSSHGSHGMINLVPLQEQANFPYAIMFLMQKEHIRYPPPLKVPVDKREMAVATLRTIPSVGVGRARDMLKHFKSLRAVFGATAEELSEVDGVGAKTAESILEFIDRKFKKKEKHII